MVNTIYLRTLLKNKGIKSIDLAKKMDITVANLNKKIRNEVEFSKKDINVILKALNMSYEDVFLSDKTVIAVNGERFIVSDKTASEIVGIITKNQAVS